jgi:hypothetical protein
MFQAQKLMAETQVASARFTQRPPWCAATSLKHGLQVDGRRLLGRTKAGVAVAVLAARAGERTA